METESVSGDNNGFYIEDLPVALAIREVSFLSNLCLYHVFTPVSTNIKLTEDSFSQGNAFRHLLKLLRDLHKFEDESHMCIQYDDHSKGDKGVQKNLRLTINGELEIAHAEYNRKQPVRSSSVHIRVYQRLQHMMYECQDIYRLLLQLRIFKPELNMNFTLKIDGSISHANFRYEHTIEVAPLLLHMVADTSYYRHQSNYRFETTRLMHIQISDTVKVSVLQDSDCDLSILLTSIAANLPIDCQQQNSEALMSLTVFGPGQFPVKMKIADSGLRNPLQDLTLEDYGIQHISPLNATKNVGIETGVLPCHWLVKLDRDEKMCPKPFLLMTFLHIDLPISAIKESQWVYMESSTVIHQLKPKICSIIQQSVDKVFNQLTADYKIQRKVKSCIRTVSKAIVDVVSGSVNEEFRQHCFSALKVSGTAEMSQKLTEKLSGFSMTKHFGHLHKWSQSRLEMKEDSSIQERHANDLPFRDVADYLESKDFVGKQQDGGAAIWSLSCDTNNDVPGLCTQACNETDHSSLKHSAENTSAFYHFDMTSQMGATPLGVSSSSSFLNQSFCDDSCQGTLQVNNCATPRITPGSNSCIHNTSPFQQLMLCEDELALNPGPSNKEVDQGNSHWTDSKQVQPTCVNARWEPMLSHSHEDESVIPIDFTQTETGILNSDSNTVPLTCDEDPDWDIWVHDDKDYSDSIPNPNTDNFKELECVKGMFLESADYSGSLDWAGEVSNERPADTHGHSFFMKDNWRREDVKPHK